MELVSADELLETESIVRSVAAVVEVVYTEGVLDVADVERMDVLDTDNKVRTEDADVEAEVVNPVLLDVLKIAEVLEVENVVEVVGTDKGTMLDEFVDTIDEVVYTLLVNETNNDPDELVVTAELAEVVGTDKMDKTEEDPDALVFVGATTTVIKVVRLELPIALVAIDELVETFKIEYADDAVVFVLPADAAETLDVADTPEVVDDTDCKVTGEFVGIADDTEIEVVDELEKLLAEAETD